MKGMRNKKVKTVGACISNNYSRSVNGKRERNECAKETERKKEKWSYGENTRKHLNK